MSKAGFSLIPDQPDAPKLVTELPGPKAQKLIERDHKVTSPSYTRGDPLVMDHAIGCVAIDSDGNHFLDLTAGIAVTSTGHCHPYVVEAIKTQADRLLHMSGTDFYYRPQVDLAERLAKLAPISGKNRVFFGNSGTEAVEAALKLCRYHTGRQNVLAFWGAFHGRTFGSMSLCGSKEVHRRGFKPLLPGVTHVSYPDPYRPAAGVGTNSVVDFTMGEIGRVFARSVNPKEVAAIFVEPIQGEGGYIVPPPEFLPRLRELCDQYDILLVCDEIQSGMGRTGKMWAVQHSGVEPDIITTAKGLASGMPLGAMIARERVMDWIPGSHASTFGGNPVCCAASLATLDLLEGGLVENAATIGEYFLAGLAELKAKHQAIGDVRGKGLMLCADFVTDRESRKGDPQTRDKVVTECYLRGLLVLGCGESGIRFAPPLCITEKQADTALAILGESLAACES